MKKRSKPFDFDRFWCTIHNLIRILTKSIGLGYFLLLKNQAQRRFMPQKAID